MNSKKGFTLIELLVVVAIIALLMSVLLPALRKAKEVAKNVICQSRQKGLYSAFAAYATDNNNFNPDARLDGTFNKACKLKNGSSFDLTELLGGYLGDNLDVFNDPFCKSGVSYWQAAQNGIANIETNYGYFCGFDFGAGPNKRFGDPLKFVNASGQKFSFYVVVADWLAYAVSGGTTEVAHQGRKGKLSWVDSKINGQYPNYVYSRFQTDAGNPENKDIGLQKFNYAYIDGSMRSFIIDEEDVSDSLINSDRNVGDTSLRFVPGWTGGVLWDQHRTLLPTGR